MKPSAILFASTYQFESVRGEGEKSGLLVLWRANDGQSFGQNPLVSVLTVKVDRAKEGRLRRVSVDPAKGQKIVFYVIINELLLPGHGARVRRPGLFR